MMFNTIYEYEEIKCTNLKALLEEYFEIIKKAKSEYKEEVIINPTVAENTTTENDE